MANKKLNRLKIVLAEKEKSNNWLAENLGKDKATISKWCTNTSQPDLDNLIKISKLLKVDVSELLRLSAKAYRIPLMQFLIIMNQCE